MNGDMNGDMRGDASGDSGDVSTGERPGGAGTRVVLRPHKTAIVAWVCAVVIVALFVFVAVVLRTSDTGVFFRTADQVSMIVMGLLIAAGLLLFARPRVRADEAGVEVRNIGITRRLRWDEVERVSFPDGSPWARLELPEDEYVPMMALQAVDGQRAVAGITRLRELHRRTRT